MFAKTRIFFRINTKLGDVTIPLEASLILKEGLLLEYKTAEAKKLLKKNTKKLKRMAIY